MHQYEGYKAYLICDLSWHVNVFSPHVTVIAKKMFASQLVEDTNLLMTEAELSMQPFF